MSVSDLQEVVRSGDGHTIYGPFTSLFGIYLAGVMLERQDYAVPIDPSRTFSKKDYDEKHDVVCRTRSLSQSSSLSPCVSRAHRTLPDCSCQLYVLGVAISASFDR